MVPLVVFYAHIIAFAAVFTKRWQEEGVSEGFLGVLFMLLIFFVGWSMASFVMRLIMPPEGFGKWMDADAAALAVLAVCESVFYYFYFRKDSPASEPEDAAISH
jgi:drug/metabolite transporter (DMT)-like permease